MKKVYILILTTLFMFNVSATELASKKSVEKLMELTEVSKMMDAMQGQIGDMFNGMSKQMDISEKEKPAFDKYMKKVGDLLVKEMNWEAIKEPMIEIYSKHFTEEEVKGLISFYQSNLGKSMTKKMPLIMQDSMLVSQDLMKDFMPKIQALAIEMKKDIKKSRQEVSEE
jgi:hypothetical protein